MSGKGNQTHSNAQHIGFLLEKGDWIHLRSMIIVSDRSNVRGRVGIRHFLFSISNFYETIVSSHVRP
ncbi:hypothetical protein PGA7_00011450 [Porphyromonas gingivalis]|nr:hypothetical protein PGA7_00011450 [Porphyromonas gingivalis]